ncbi:hypothetical protein M0R45_025193 [Rubus argutus]|uniref:Uncharacterized protein n=1 Tax=Rubus argutus TaxID=59490 RepID=A0AAW1WU05_RUBAR
MRLRVEEEENLEKGTAHRGLPLPCRCYPSCHREQSKPRRTKTPPNIHSTFAVSRPSPICSAGVYPLCP